MSIRTGRNGPAIALMILAMVGFALADSLIKLSSQTGSGGAGPGQIIVFQGISGVILFGAITLRTGDRITRATMLDRMVQLRTLGDLLAVVSFTTALTLMPVGDASAILQIQPLVLMLGAAWFLKEAVTPVRWAAAALGFAGVMMIVRPGLDAFHPAAPLVLLAVLGLAIRDLTTRLLGQAHSTAVVALLISAAMIPVGLLTHLLMSVPVDLAAETVAILVGSSICAMAAYYAITQAMRMGEVSAVAPYRYSRLVAAFVIAALMLGERPDIWTLLGSAIIVAAGIWILLEDRAR